MFTRRYTQHSNIRPPCLNWIKLHVMENSLMYSFDRSVLKLSRQPLNIFTVFNGLHMPQNNISLPWMEHALHFHLKQIQTERVWRRVHTETGKTWGRLWWLLTMSYTCLFVFKQTFLFGVSTELDHITGRRWRHNAGAERLIHSFCFHKKRGTDYANNVRL